MKKLRARFNEDGQRCYADIQFKLMFYGSYIKAIDRFIDNLLSEIEQHESVEKDSIILKYATYRNDNYKDIQYESVIISMYSSFEKNLFLLCKILEKEQNIKVVDFGKKGIFKYKQYLEKVIKLDFGPVTNEWNSMTHYNKLRNHLVHSAEKRELSDDISNSLKNLNGIAIIPNELTKEFIFTSNLVLIDFLTAIKRILDHLNFEEIDNSDNR